MPEFTVLEICQLWLKSENASGQCLEGIKSPIKHAVWRLWVKEFGSLPVGEPNTHEAAYWSALACSPNACTQPGKGAY